MAELTLRIFILRDKIIQELPYTKSDIRGVPYLQINLSKYLEKKNKPRIIIIGDYISIHRSYAKNNSLDEVLNSKLDNSYEIINTGACFYSIPEEINLLKNRMIEFDPDYIIIVYVLNDIDFNNPTNAILPLTIKMNINKINFLSPTIIKYLIRKQKLSNVCKLYYNKESWINYYYNKYNEPLHKERYENYVKELGYIQNQKNIPVIFVIIPIFYNFQDERIISISNDLYYICKKNDLICTNILDKFMDYNVSHVKEDDNDIWHPNAQGIEIIAEEIHKQILIMEKKDNK